MHLFHSYNLAKIVQVRFLLMNIVFAGAYDPLDPHGDIKIKWDLVSWTPDGYVVNTYKFTHLFSCYYVLKPR